MPENSVQTNLSTFGNFELFIPGGGDFEEYLERMEFYFLINKIHEDRQKCAAFVVLAGKDIYNILSRDISPRKVADLTFGEMKRILMAKFATKSNQMSARCAFYKRCQKEKEAISAFAEDLRALAEKCSFGGFLDDVLRDVFICGIRNGIIKNKLIDDNNENFKDALEKALNLEIVEEIAKGMHGY